MPVKHQPDLMFLRQVPLNRIHIFTLIQLFCLGVLWLIKSTDAALIFPVMVCIFFSFFCCLFVCFNAELLLLLLLVLVQGKKLFSGSFF